MNGRGHCEIALVLVMLLAACAPKGNDAPAAGTAAGADSVSAQDHLRADSAGTKAADGVTVSTSSKVVQKADSIIGRDSAFGPKFEVDASGKTTPIKRP